MNEKKLSDLIQIFSAACDKSRTLVLSCEPIANQFNDSLTTGHTAYLSPVTRIGLDPKVIESTREPSRNEKYDRRRKRSWIRHASVHELSPLPAGLWTRDLALDSPAHHWLDYRENPDKKTNNRGLVGLRNDLCTAQKVISQCLDENDRRHGTREDNCRLRSRTKHPAADADDAVSVAAAGANPQWCFRFW